MKTYVHFVCRRDWVVNSQGCLHYYGYMGISHGETTLWWQHCPVRWARQLHPCKGHLPDIAERPLELLASQSLSNTGIIIPQCTFPSLLISSECISAPFSYFWNLCNSYLFHRKYTCKYQVASSAFITMYLTLPQLCVLSGPVRLLHTRASGIISFIIPSSGCLVNGCLSDLSFKQSAHTVSSPACRSVFSLRASWPTLESYFYLMPHTVMSQVYCSENILLFLYYL